MDRASKFDPVAERSCANLHRTSPEWNKSASPPDLSVYDEENTYDGTPDLEDGGPDLTKYFELLGLSEDATLDDLDEKYSMHAAAIERNKTSDPTWKSTKFAEIDEAYAQLLKSYIHGDCGRMRYRAEEPYTMHEVLVRKHEAVSSEGASTSVIKDIKSKRARNLEAFLESQDIDTPAGQTPFTIYENFGYIFGTPERSVIVHAVNCLGEWGAGFAAELKMRYPIAYDLYQKHCEAQDLPGSLLGKSFLIAPHKSAKQPCPYWIACLFTSVGYGKGNAQKENPGKTDPDGVLEATVDALLHFRECIGHAKTDYVNTDLEPGAIYSPMFNSGLFEVPWEKTKKAMLKCFQGYDGKWTVIVRPSKMNRTRIT